MRRPAATLCLAALLGAVVLAGARAEEAWPMPGWEIVPAKERAVGEESLAPVLRFAEEQNTTALLVVRDGRLESEHYFGDAKAENAHPLASAAKSVTSLLVGIAVDEGKLPGVETPVSTWFPESKVGAATLADLLTMRSGLPYDKGLQVGMHRAPDWLAYIQSQEPVHEPGERFQYSGFDPILLSAILRKATGQALDQYAGDKLFRPLGITTIFWDGDEQGLINGGSQLSLTARDFARIGLLCLREGRWQDRRIVPADWLKRSTRNQFAAQPWYGYYWWRLNAETEASDPRLAGAYFASGAGGQHLIVLPELDTAIVRFGSNPRLTPSGQTFVPELLRRYLAALPAPRDKADVVLEESFETELSDDWFWGLGTWTAKDGVLRGFESGPRRHGPVKLRRLAFTGANISYEFRLEGQAPYSSFPINGARERGHILNVVMERSEFRIIAHIRRGESVDLVREKITLDPEREWHPVRILLRDETITVDFNGRTWTAAHPAVAEPKENFGFGGDSGGPGGETAGALEFRKLRIRSVVSSSP